MAASKLDRFIHPKSRAILKPILREWIEVNKCLASSWGWKDCPWWCNERASVSTWAAAVWNARGRALEEFGDKKTYRNSKYEGRCDLYFEFGEEAFYAEAKHLWVAAGRRSRDHIAAIEEAQNSACKDARHVNEKGQKIGIVFVVPYFHKSDKNEVSQLLKSWQAEVLKISFHGLGWLFPEEARHLKWKGDPYIYPGVVAVISKASGR